MFANLMSETFFRKLGMDRQTFFDQYWQKAPVQLQAEQIPAFSKKDAEKIFANFLLKHDQIRVVKPGNEISPSELATSTGNINLSKLSKYYENGYSIVIPMAQKFNSNLLEYCSYISKYMGASVQANIYISPPNAQGFKPHWDSHDVLVYQLDGEKTWQVFDAPHVDLPTKDMKCIANRLDLTQPSKDFCLQLGSVIYLPRGFTHCAKTDNSYSMHVTFALEYNKISDLLHKIVDKLLVTHRSLRLAAPMYSTWEDFPNQESLVQAWQDIVTENLFQQVLLDSEARNTFNFEITTPSLLSAPARELLSNTLLEPKAEALWSIYFEADKLICVVPQMKFEIAESDRPLFLEILAQTHAFRLQDLHSWEASDQAIASVSRLISHQVLKFFD